MSTIRKFTAEAWKRGEQFRASEVANGLPPNQRLIETGQVVLAIGWRETHDNLCDLIEDAPTDRSVDLIIEAFAIGYKTAVKREKVTA